jgi:hypothetical protein
VQLQKSIDEGQLYLTDPVLGNKDESKVIIGLLFKLGYIRPESFLFVQKYLQYMGFCKCGLMLMQAIDQQQGMNLH